MLLAHKIELRPTPEQEEHLRKACGSRRHCFNRLLAHFKQDGVKWSKRAAYQHYIGVLRKEFPWYDEVSARVTRNAIDDLDDAFKHFFRRVRAGKRPFGFPRFKRKGQRDSFALRESEKFDVAGRRLRIEKLNTRILMRQGLRWNGERKRVTISERAGKFYASILVDVTNYEAHDPSDEVVGVDVGIKNLAVLSDGTAFPANQRLRAGLCRLRRLSRNLSRKQPGSNRRAKAKLRLARLHKRIADQRNAALHEVSDHITRNYRHVVIENLNVRGMMANRCLARAVSDAGFYGLRRQIEYKAKLRGGHVHVVSQWFPSSKMCSACGTIHDMPLGKRTMSCECGNEMDRDLNAAINLKNNLDRLRPDSKRAQERRKTGGFAVCGCVDGANMATKISVDCVDYGRHLWAVSNG